MQGSVFASGSNSLLIKPWLPRFDLALKVRQRELAAAQFHLALLPQVSSPLLHSLCQPVKSFAPLLQRGWQHSIPICNKAKGWAGPQARCNPCATSVPAAVGQCTAVLLTCKDLSEAIGIFQQQASLQGRQT